MFKLILKYNLQVCSTYKLHLFILNKCLVCFRFVSSSVYYGLNFNTRNLAGDRYMNIFIAGLVEIPALVFVLLVNNKIGRRRTISILMTIAGISCFSILFIELACKLNSTFLLYDILLCGL